MKYLEIMVFYPPGKGPRNMPIESQVLGITDEYAFTAIRDGLHGNPKGSPVEFNLSEGLILRLSAKEGTEPKWRKWRRRLFFWRHLRPSLVARYR